MQKNRSRAILAAAAIAVLPGSSLLAETWNQTAVGTYNWIDTPNWLEGTVPNGVGATANLTNDIVGEQDVVIPTAGAGGITLGVLNIGDGGVAPDSKWDLSYNSLLTFDNGASDAQINSIKDTTGINGWDVIWCADIKLNSNLVVNTGPNAASTLRINGTISNGANGPRTLTKTGPGFLEIGQVGTHQAWTGGTILTGGRIRLNIGGGFNLLPGDIDISGGATLQGATGNGEGIADTAVIGFSGIGYYNPGFDQDTDVETVGGLQGVGDAVKNVELGGGDGTVRFGGDNADHVFEGRFGYSGSWVKIGSGVQEFGGPNGNWTSGATPRTFGVLGGRVDLNKPDGVASVAQQNVTIGDGTQVGVARPELRLLQSNQIDVRAYDAPTGTETNVMTLNSGIFNVNGMTETVGSAIVTGAGTSTIDLGTGGNLRFDTGLTVDLGATGEVVSTDHRALNVAGTLTVNGRLDLKENKLVVVAGDLGSWDGTTYTGVTGLIKTGRANGDWSGNGIVTSETEATTGVLTGLAVANAEDVGKAGGTFGGQSVNTGDVLVMYTWGGDAQMDGDLDGDDYFQIDSNVAQSGSVFGYSKGDFNLDGLINGDDYFIIDSNIAFAQTQPNWPTGAGVAGVAAVPEPASMGVLALAASALMRRRRRA